MAVTLTDEQKTELTKWVGEGATLAEVQKRLAEKFSVSLTYMDTRFLLDDLNLTLKDIVKVTAASADLTKSAVPDAPGPAAPMPGAGDGPPISGKVRVSVDKVVRPGAVVSGNVTFSDGKSADWYLDQTGRLGLVPKIKGYQPSAPDVQEFQYTLQEELARLGY